MKKILFLILVCAFIPVGAFATRNGGDIGTDYWGTTYGCACNGGGVQVQKSRGNRIFSPKPGKELQCGGCWLFCNDRWKEIDGGWCNNISAINNSGNPDLITKMDEARKCWTRTCPDGSYFTGNPDGKIDYSKCVKCTGMSQTVSDGVCWNVLCGSGNAQEDALTRGKRFGTEVVIYNGKCMPVCDLQTAGAVYDNADSTYIGIKIKSKSAGVVGRPGTSGEGLAVE